MSEASAIPEHLVAYGEVMSDQSTAVTTAAGPLGEALDAFRSSDSDGMPAVPALDDTMRSLATDITTVGDFANDVGLAFERAAGSGQRAPGMPVTVSESDLDTALDEVKAEQIARGEELARRIRELMGNPDEELETASVTQEQMAELLEELEGIDPDAAAGLVNELGVEGVDDMLDYIEFVRADVDPHDFGDEPGERDAGIDARFLAPFATTVALATHSDSLSYEVRSGLIGGNPYDRDVDLDDQQLDRVTQLLRYGSYETNFLVAAAERVMDAAPEPINEHDLENPLRPSQIAAEALERNPEAAWKFMWNREENSALLIDPLRYGDGNEAAGRVAELGLLTYPAEQDDGARQLATMGTEYFIHNVNEAGADHPDNVPDPLKRAGAAVIFPHRERIAELSTPGTVSESPGETGFNVGRDDLRGFLTVVADDEVARDRMAVTAQVYAGEQIRDGIDASLGGDHSLGSGSYVKAGNLMDLFSDAVGDAVDDQAEADAYRARLRGAAAKTAIEIAGGASAAAGGPWAVPVTMATDGAKSILSFIVDESTASAEAAAQARADSSFNDYVHGNDASVQALIADTLIHRDGALDDPPTIPTEFDPNGDGHLDLPAPGTPEYNDFTRWLLADEPGDLPPSVAGGGQAEIERLRAMQGRLVEIYGTMDEFVSRTR